MTERLELGGSTQSPAGVAQLRGAAAQGDLLLVAPQGVTFEGLLQATRNALPDLQASLIDRLPDLGMPDHGIRLVLLYAGISPDLVQFAARCRANFPAATIALMTDSPMTEIPDLGDLLESRLVQGLLPLSLPLNTWFAALNLLLNGGEYYPSALVRQPPNTEGRRHPRMLARSLLRTADPNGEPAPALAELTTRERQVLELVSEGCQNKLIANRMALSEHTVKVHVHHLIKKLGVHNRTQAAAAFRAYRGQQDSALPLRDRNGSGLAAPAGRR